MSTCHTFFQVPEYIYFPPFLLTQINSTHIFSKNEYLTLIPFPIVDYASLPHETTFESRLTGRNLECKALAINRLATAVPPGVGLPTQRVLHLLEVHVGDGDGRRPFLLEAGLAIERHQEVLADQQSPAQAWHAAQMLQVAPEDNGAFALLTAVAVHRQDVDVHCGGVWDMEGHGLLEKKK